MNNIADYIVYEHHNLIKKMFHTNDEQPSENDLICIYYNHELYFDMFKSNNKDYVKNDEGYCRLPWKDVEFWCYMSDVKKILKTAYNQERKANLLP